MFLKKGKKVCLIGLDGVPFSLIKKITDNDTTPNLASLFKTGVLKQMSVSIPEISSVSWSSFMTGTDSGNHGIYGFMDVRDGSRQMYFPNYKDLKTETLWSSLERLGKQSVVVNLPSTYPAGRINGILVSGFVAIDLKKAVYPSSLISKLEGLNYKIDVRAHLAKDNPAFLFEELFSVLDIRFKAFDLLANEIDWDFFMPVITGTDRLHHFLWSSSIDPTNKYYNSFFDYYKKLDDKIGRLLESLPTGTEVMAMSDHGFTNIETEVYLNRWLFENNYLCFTKDNPMDLRDISSSSKAFSLDPSRIYINKQSRFTDGIISDNDVKKIVDELADSIIGLEYNGKKVIKQIYRPEEIYSNKEIGKAPDLVLLSNHGYDLKGKLNAKDVFGRSHFTGTHTQDDAFIFSTNCLPKDKITIFDIKTYIENLVS
jgi:predicted AlkP superfamily phosphohydrolase/phosphomutase